jgi:hypothetical protein
MTTIAKFHFLLQRMEGLWPVGRIERFDPLTTSTNSKTYTSP